MSKHKVKHSGKHAEKHHTLPDPYIPPATPEDPNPPEEGPDASLPNEGTGVPILHRLPPSSGSGGAKKG